ncbi:hypothetical protein GJ496_005821 [Pomphorhynchus laevis]|nr:hypothetical protein GJ496_005821 [Pomphorhynchus laevis]
MNVSSASGDEYYRKTLHEQLLPEVARIQSLKDKLHEDLAQLLQLKNYLTRVCSYANNNNFTARVDIGCGIFRHSTFVEMTVDEAMATVGKHQQHLENKLEVLNTQCQELRATARLVMAGMFVVE